MFTVRHWQERLYPDPEQRDPVSRFVRGLEGRIASTSRVLDIGAGAGERNRYALRGRCEKVVGIDVDPRVIGNPLLDHGVVTDGASIPFPEESFDVVFSIYVLEHVRDPSSFASEIRRVLKRGGVFLALAPNRCHYVPLIARLTPTSFHKRLNKVRGRDAEDTFPTFYRMNTRAALRRHFETAGMETITIKTIEVQPNYLLFSLPSFFLGALYERVVNSTELLAGMRVNIISEFRKT